MALSYEYSIGSVRAREKNLFSRADLENMLSLKDMESLSRFLRDKSFSEGETVEEMLKNSTKDTMSYLYSVVPDESIFNAFLYVNDAHNIKSVIKGILAGADYKRLFVSPCTISTDDIETAVKENKYELLPESFCEAAKKAYETLAHTADARLADAYIDRACMTAQLKAAEETKTEFLTEYLELEIFWRLVKIALRGAKTGAGIAYYEEAFCEGVKGFDVKEITAAALKGEEAVCEYFSAKDINKSREAMERYKSSPAEFEKFTENLLMSLAIEKCRRGGTGAEAAIGYYLGSLAQRRAVQIIASGIRTRTDGEITRERLREIYG